MSAPSFDAGHKSQGRYSGCSELAESIIVGVTDSIGEDGFC